MDDALSKMPGMERIPTHGRERAKVVQQLTERLLERFDGAEERGRHVAIVRIAEGLALFSTPRRGDDDNDPGAELAAERTARVVADTFRHEGIAVSLDWLHRLRKATLAIFGEAGGERVYGFFDRLSIALARCSSEPAKTPVEGPVLEALFDHHAVGAVLLDDLGNILRSNPAMRAILGRGVEELRQHPVWEFLHPDERMEARAGHRAGVRGALGSWQLERRFVRGDGDFGYTSVRAFIVRDPHGGHLATIQQWTDISEVRRHHDALRETERLLQCLLENSPAVIYLKDSDGRIVVANRAFELVLNLPREQILGKTSLELFGEHGADAIDGHDAMVAASRARFDCEEEVLQADGIHTYLSVKVPVSEIGYRNAVLLGISTDITARKRAEEGKQAIEQQLRQAQKVESLRSLAGGLAHDFNNLLGVILGNAGLALMDAGQQPLIADALVEIQVAAVRAAELTSLMLAYAGEGGFVREPVSLADMVEGMFSELAAILAPGLSIAYVLDHDVPGIEADGHQLRQILLHLVTNAAEALGTGGGTIRVRVRSTDVSDRELFDSNGLPLARGHYAVLEVTDRGGGMDKITLTRIFDPFFTTKFLGRGLGLPAVQGIVRAHRGAITVKSATGHGTTFRVFLPCSEGEGARHSVWSVEPWIGPISESFPWTSEGTVLVVDDEEGVRFVVARMLERIGFDVVEAANGETGVDCLSAHPEAKLIVLDLSMPGMGGASALHRIRELRPEVPVLITSGHSAQETREQLRLCDTAAHTAFLKKPYAFGPFVAKVRAMLEPSTTFRQTLPQSRR